MYTVSEKMYSCKACGHEIAKSAKSCPHCGARNKKGHPVLIGVLVAVALIGIIGSMGSDEEPVRVDGNPTGQTQEKENIGTTLPSQTETADKKEDNIFLVGETAELSKIVVSMVNVTESTGSAYNTPTEGNVFVLCEFEIANNSDEEITVSSMMSFEGYCDDYSCTYSLSAIMEKGNKNQLDGTVAPGKKINGVIGYEVPADWKELEIHFTPNVWRGKEIVFIATNN